jgi:hypothetical protein
MSFDPQPPSTVWTTDGHVRCAVPRSHIAAFAVIAVTSALAGIALPPTGRVLFWVLAIAALVVAARDAFSGPTLLTDGEGVSFVRWWRRERLGWSQLEAVRVYRHRRLRALELDAGDELVVLPARRLGADLDEVVEALRAERRRH